MYSQSSWRNTAAPIIAECLKQYPDDEKALRAALRAAYPFGERQYHPYKIWLNEIQRQRGLRPRLGARYRVGKFALREPDQRQSDLFTGPTDTATGGLK